MSPSGQPPTLDEVELLRDGTVLRILQPHRNLDLVRRLLDKKITSFAMELIPRISRAQSMDVLSSQAAVAGYKVRGGQPDPAAFFRC